MLPEHRVAFYIPELTIGGAQRVTVTLANALPEYGIPTDVVLSWSDGPLADDLTDDVRVVALGSKRVPSLGIATSIPDLARYLSRERPSVLFSQMTYASLAALSAVELARADVALFGVEHSEYASRSSAKDRLVASVMRYAYPRMDGLLAVSKGVAESVVAVTNLDRNDVTVVANPVDVESVRAEADEDPKHHWLATESLDVVLAVGRFDPRKDYPTLIRAFARVHERRPSTRLVILGDGPRMDELTRLAGEYDVEDVVAFPGSVRNPYSYMTRASLLALSSRSEGLPTVLIEALTCGCPIVSTDCSTGPREILDDGTYGQLVPVGDSAALARAICSTLDAEIDEASLRARAERFSTERVAKEYAALIRSVGCSSSA